MREHGVVGPEELWTAWSWNPWIALGLFAAGALYGKGVLSLWTRAGRGAGIRGWQAASYYCGLAALVAALLSPVAAGGSALFSIHMVQHLLLMVTAPPLLLLGRPLVAYLWGAPARWRQEARRLRPSGAGARRIWRSLTHPITILLLHVGTLWAWHVPALYEAALAHPGLHHLEHLTFFISATLFWWLVVHLGVARPASGYGAGVLYVFATALQSGALGALITFASRPWYPAHAPGAAAWGVDLLQDQQLAGILMWVPAGLVYASAAVVLFLGCLREGERAVERQEEGRGWMASPVPPEGTRETISSGSGRGWPRTRG